jgi:hypothetical protein
MNGSQLMHLRKPTTVERTTLDLQARMIVEPEYDAPPTTVRRVRLTVPPGVRVAIAIDSPTPNAAGPGRAYKFVALPGNVIVPIWLQPSQAIYGLCLPGENGMAEVGYICEFFDEEGMA